jgi:hypothetical protein
MRNNTKAPFDARPHHSKVHRCKQILDGLERLLQTILETVRNTEARESDLI